MKKIFAVEVNSGDPHKGSGEFKNVDVFDLDLNFSTDRVIEEILEDEPLILYDWVSEAVKKVVDYDPECQGYYELFAYASELIMYRALKEFVKSLEKDLGLS